MASILDFSQFTFTAEQIRDVKELVFDEVLQAPEIDLLHTVYPAIVFDKEIGFIGKGGLIGKAAQGCNPTPQAYNIGTRMVKWEPKSWGFYIQQCATDIESTAALYSLKTGVAFSDFTATDYIAIVVGVLANSVKEFIIRLAWFNDTLADNITNGGTLTNGTDKTYFNILDGLWKQLLAEVTASPAQQVSISENAGVDYIAQRLDPANMKDYLESLVFDSNVLLRSNANAKIYCTQTFYDAYAKSLTGVTLESLYANLINGIRTLTFNGIALVPVPIWDAMISAYFNTGTKLINPHRALFTSKDYLAFGVDSESSFGDMLIYYDQKTEYVDIKGRGKADVKLLNPAMFQLAI